MVLDELPSGVIERGKGHLIIRLRLGQGEFGLRELGLGVKDKERGFRTELMLAFFGTKIFLREIDRDGGGFEREFGLFELMNGIGDIEGDALRSPHLLILIVLPAYEGIR